MTTHVALLRGVNVAGHGKVKMDDLRQLFHALGYTDVTTYIQSGNVVFTSDTAVTAEDLEAAIAAGLDLDTTVVLRTAAEMESVLTRNPFDADPSELHVGFMPEPPARAAVKGLELERFEPDEVIVEGRDLFLHLPDGIGRAKLPDYVARQLKVPFTVRNWRTFTKLVELSQA